MQITTLYENVQSFLLVLLILLNDVLWRSTDREKEKAIDREKKKKERLTQVVPNKHSTCFNSSLKKTLINREFLFCYSFFFKCLIWLSEMKVNTQPSLMHQFFFFEPGWEGGRGFSFSFSFFSESQSQSPKGFIRVVCGSQSMERAKRRSQSGISGCGHGRWVVPHSRHVSEPTNKSSWQ